MKRKKLIDEVVLFLQMIDQNNLISDVIGDDQFLNKDDYFDDEENEIDISQLDHRLIEKNDKEMDECDSNFLNNYENIEIEDENNEEYIKGSIINIEIIKKKSFQNNVNLFTYITLEQPNIVLQLNPENMQLICSPLISNDENSIQNTAEDYKENEKEMDTESLSRQQIKGGVKKSNNGKF